MKNLLSVVRLVSRQKLRKLDIVTEDTLDAKASKFRQFYDALQGGTVRNDREAARLLYGADPTDARYRQLKSRLRRRLLNTVFFVDRARGSGPGGIDAAEHELRREWALVQILRVNGARDAAHAQARGMLSRAERYQLSDLTEAIAALLLADAAAAGDRKAARRYETLLDAGRIRRQRELSGAAALATLRLAYADARLRRLAPADLADAERAHRTLGQIGRGADGGHDRVYYDGLEARALLAACTHRHAVTADACRRAFAHAESGAVRRLGHAREHRFALLWARACVSERDLATGEGVLAAARTRHRPASQEADHVARLSAALRLACGQPGDALDLARAAQRRRGFRQRPAAEREAWALLSAFGRILARLTAPSLAGRPPRATLAAETETGGAPASDTPGFGERHARLAALRLVAEIAQRRLDAPDGAGLGERIGTLRHAAIKRLDPTADARLIAFAQLLYRLERTGFDGRVDRVGERYLDDLRRAPHIVSLEPGGAYAPVDLADLLPAFGLDAAAALA